MQKAFLLLPLIVAAQTQAKDGDFLSDIASDTTVSEAVVPSIRTLELNVDSDFLLSDDIDIQRYSAGFEHELDNLTIGLTYTYSRYDIEYSPSTVGFENDRTEDNHQVSLSVAQDWNDSWSSNISVTGYRGFTDFRSIWTSEFFEQSFQFFPTFEEPDPFGVSVSLGTTYTLPNEVDTISIDAGYSRDRIAPGFEIGEETGQLESSEDILETVSVGLTGNFYITNKITSQLFARVAFVTDREIRTQLRANVAWAFYDGFTLRGEVGATYEPADFEALFGGLSLNYQITSNLEASLGYRIYEDTGEITTSNFNTAAPGVETREAFVSLLYTLGAHSFRASVALLDSDFEPVSIANIPFENLFQDREFLALRAAYSYSF